MTAKHKRVLAQAKKLVADYKRAVRKLERFKAMYCRSGDKIGKTGTHYCHYSTKHLGRLADPDEVPVVFGPENKTQFGFYPLVSAIREDVEK